MSDNPKPHTHEWKRMIFMAMAGGITFDRRSKFNTGLSRFSRTMWVARYQDGSVCCHRDTKYEAAAFAVACLMGNSPPLSDAAPEFYRPGGPRETN